MVMGPVIHSFDVNSQNSNFSNNRLITRKTIERASNKYIKLYVFD